MTREHSRVELKVADDRRLVAGVGGAVEHFASRAGLDATGQQNFVVAVEMCCRETLRLLGGNKILLAVTIQEFDDRIEVTLIHAGPPVAVSPVGTFRASGAAARGANEKLRFLLARVDAVEYRSEGPSSCLTLAKYVARPPSDL